MDTWHDKSAVTALEMLSVDSSAGLGEDEVVRRRGEYGANRYTVKKADSLALMVVHQFRDVANVILLIAFGLSLALAIREGHGYIEPIVIGVIVVMNVALAVSQERGAEKALAALQSLNSPTCVVLRDGSRLEVATADVVPGDILLLKTGDLVAADARLVESTDLAVDESSLTGESEASEKDASATLDKAAGIGDQTNMVFSGCLVTAGNAQAVVVATGMNTQMGKIAGYLNDVQKLQTPLQKRLNRVSQTMSVVAIVSAAVFLVIGLRQGDDFWVMALAAVSLAVASVPETLQLIATLSLTNGVRQMVARHALVRKLPAVETLGNCSVICSDKTGTLTQNRMAIQRLWVPGGEPAFVDDQLTRDQWGLVKYLVLASNASVETADDGKARIVGDATETAIMRLLLGLDGDPVRLAASNPRVGEVAFSSARKMMTTVHSRPDGGYLVLTKGAFDRLPFKRADAATTRLRQQIHDDFGHDALRVIALGSKVVAKLPDDLTKLERDLEFVGIIGLIDPPRPEAKESIAIARRAGVRTVMITGDHAATAGAIARQLGLMGEDGVVVTGQDLAAMSDHDLIATVMDNAVYARVSPEDKIRIVEAWQEHGEVVSMTGDGVNDAPALKAADVGVAMGIAGTEVAKSAADIVLTDDNFSTIVAAIREGRTVFSNIRKTIDFLLAANLSEIVIMLAATIMGWGKPLTPIMLLLINVVGDGVPGLRLAREPSDEQIMARRPIGRAETFFGDGVLRSLIQDTIAFSVVGLAAYYIGAFAPFGGAEESAWPVLTGQTMAFLVVGFTSILRIFTVRSRRSVFRHPVSTNWPLFWAAWAMVALFAVMALVPPFGAIFGVVAISWQYWLVVIGLSLIPTVVAEIAKAINAWQERHDHARRLVHHETSDLIYI
ncbi:MAG: cation-translocating P-type ATPase [Propionibacteriaceae bacterium]|nr:cation-translocating P-type ATPase [Propionibacteriaceae bacterium]